MRRFSILFTAPLCFRAVGVAIVSPFVLAACQSTSQTPQANVTTQPAKPVSLSGKVLYGKKPGRGFKVKATPVRQSAAPSAPSQPPVAPSTAEEFSFSTNASATGEFRLTLPAGTYTIAVQDARGHIHDITERAVLTAVNLHEIKLVPHPADTAPEEVFREDGGRIEVDVDSTLEACSDAKDGMHNVHATAKNARAMQAIAAYARQAVVARCEAQLGFTNCLAKSATLAQSWPQTERLVAHAAGTSLAARVHASEAVNESGASCIVRIAVEFSGVAPSGGAEAFARSWKPALAKGQSGALFVGPRGGAVVNEVHTKLNQCRQAAEGLFGTSDEESVRQALAAKKLDEEKAALKACNDSGFDKCAAAGFSLLGLRTVVDPATQLTVCAVRMGTFFKGEARLTK